MKTIEIIVNDHYKVIAKIVDDTTIIRTDYELMGLQWVALGNAETWDKNSFVESLSDMFE